MSADDAAARHQGEWICFGHGLDMERGVIGLTRDSPPG